MKITKIFSLIAISASLILSSCSMNKEAGNTAYLKSGKLQSQQELASKHSNLPPQASVGLKPHIEQVIANQSAAIPENNTANVNTPVAPKHSKAFAKSNLVKRTGDKLAAAITVSKAAGTVERLMKKPSSAASINRIGHATDMNYLVMWIVFLLASIVFFILAGLFTLSLSLGLAVIFSILGFLASLAALIFFILWIVQLIKS